jgi:predicted GTPase
MISNISIRSHVNKYIQDIHKRNQLLLNPPPEKSTSPVLESKHPINAVILGKPLSGKSVVCKALAAAHSLHVIDPEHILKKCIT